MNDEVRAVTKHLPLKGRGLEVAPLFRPTLSKTAYNIDYTDYTSAKELRKKQPDPAIAKTIVDLDFIWRPGKRLKACAKKRQYDYVIARHVWEHVPNPMGWLEQILEICNPGAVIGLALPTKANPIDYERRETSLSELIGAYVEDRAFPSPAQVFDCLYRARLTEGTPQDIYAPEKFPKFPRSYPGQAPLDFARLAKKQYLDVHCSVFSPESLAEIFREIIALGILKIEVVEIVPSVALGGEFYVHLRKAA